MNRAETASLYAFICSLYEREPRREVAEAWHTLLRDVPFEVALDGARRLCQRGTGFPPKADEILAEANRMVGGDAPDVEAAAGLYLSGDWDAHPAVRRAASKVHWDMRLLPDKAERQFRSIYASLVFTDGLHERRAIKSGDGPKQLGELLAKAQDDER